MPLRDAALLIVLLAAGPARALTLPERPAARVNDYAGALAAAARDRLEQQIAAATEGRSLQIAVAIFKSLEGESLEDVSIRLADRWKIGGKGSDDGVLITVFVDDQKLRIEVGYGLEGALPDVRASRIIREVIAPRLRAGDLEGGLRDGIAAIVDLVGGGSGPSAPVRALSPRPAPRIGLLPIALIVIVVVLVLAVAGGRRSAGWSGGSGGFASQAGSSLLWSVLWSLLLGGGRGGRGGGGWGDGGGGGGGGWGGGGGGGFGGGGASGSW